jgi:hypothetical protein
MLECIGRAFLIAFGAAVATALTSLLVLFIAGLIIGAPFGGIGGAAGAIAAIVGFALAVFALEAALLIAQCIVAGETADADTADNQGDQGLTEEGSKGPSVKIPCPICLRLRPYTIAGLLAGIIIVLR